MREHEGLIQTPNYPNKYPRISDCLWEINFGPGMDIDATFQSLSVEDENVPCKYDYVALTGTNLSRTVCGFNVPPPVSVKAGPLKIGFVSDDDTEFLGFSLHYKAEGKFLYACFSGGQIAFWMMSYTMMLLLFTEFRYLTNCLIAPSPVEDIEVATLWKIPEFCILQFL